MRTFNGLDNPMRLFIVKLVRQNEAVALIQTVTRDWLGRRPGRATHRSKVTVGRFDDVMTKLPSSSPCYQLLGTTP